MAGLIRVWGGGLSEVQYCEVDAHGNLCGGPVVPDQDELEGQIRGGEESGVTDSEVCWEYRERRAAHDHL